MALIRAISNRLAAPYWAYELIQRAVGVPTLIEMIRPYFLRSAGARVLDVGGGTGLWAAALPASSHYACLDNDPEKLRGLQRRMPQAWGILGDAMRMGFADRTWDFSMCNFVAHHLDDGQAAVMFKELARITRGQLFFLEPLQWDAWMSRMLWAGDRGSNPRSREKLLEMLSRDFEITESAHFHIRHHYLLCVATPKPV
jgi:ubiquinone/menaquinone biosynthesis C-methylase UbiE